MLSTIQAQVWAQVNPKSPYLDRCLLLLLPLSVLLREDWLLCLPEALGCPEPALSNVCDCERDCSERAKETPDSSESRRLCG